MFFETERSELEREIARHKKSQFVEKIGDEYVNGKISLEEMKGTIEQYETAVQDNHYRR